MKKAACNHLCKKWQCDLLGRPIIIYTDYQTLENFNMQCNLFQQQIQWQLMAQYDLMINHIHVTIKSFLFIFTTTPSPAVRHGPIQGGNGWFSLRELVRSCTTESSQFLVISGVKGTSLVQVQRAQGREKACKGGRQNMDLDMRREVESGGNASMYSLDTDTVLYTEVWCVSSEGVKKTMWRVERDDKGN
jgi:hypothetical protein